MDITDAVVSHFLFSQIFIIQVQFDQFHWLFYHSVGNLMFHNGKKVPFD